MWIASWHQTLINYRSSLRVAWNVNTGCYCGGIFLLMCICRKNVVQMIYSSQHTWMDLTVVLLATGADLDIFTWVKLDKHCSLNNANNNHINIIDWNVQSLFFLHGEIGVGSLFCWGGSPHPLPPLGSPSAARYWSEVDLMGCCEAWGLWWRDKLHLLPYFSTSW